MRKYNQGDVILTPIDEIPKGAKPLKTKVIAEGEETGHHHQFNAMAPVTVFMDGQQNTYVEVLEDGILLGHDEHDQHAMRKGFYKMDIQRELDLAKTVRKVLD